MIIKVKSKLRKLAILFTLFLLNFFTAFTQEVFEKNNKFGLKDSLGKTIVRAKYDLIDPFRNEFLGQQYTNLVTRFKEDGKWGVINRKGKEIIEPVFDDISKIDFLNETNLIDVQLNGKWGVYNFEGKEIVKPLYFKSLNSEVILPTRIISIKQDNTFINGNLNLVFGLMDSNFNVIITPKYAWLKEASLRSLRLNNFVASKVGSPKKYGLIDIEENIIFDFKYENISQLSKDLVSINKGGKWQILNSKGFSVNNTIYDAIGYLKNKRVLVMKNNSMGYIDEKGKEVISCVYSNAENFDEKGIATVTYNNYTFTIDINGNREEKRETIEKRSLLEFTSITARNIFNTINFKENVEDSSNLLKVDKYIEESNPYADVNTQQKLIFNLISEASNNKNSYKAIINYLYNKNVKNNIVCYDAITVYLIQSYICNTFGPFAGAYWLSNTEKDELKKFAKSLSPLLCNEIAPNFKLKLLPQIKEKSIYLSQIKADYIVLFFWKNKCVYCEKEWKLLLENYNNLMSLKHKVEIIGISIDEKDQNNTEQIIANNEINWINGVDLDLKITNLYSIKKVSNIYLLDKDKKIIVKNVNASSVVKYLNSR